MSWKPIETAPLHQRFLSCSGYRVQIVQWDGCEYWTDFGAAVIQPDAWMPLPEPPQ